MADISRGPVGTLPYSRYALPEGTMCDEHPKRKAVARVQGETDSFGCEYNDACSQCLKEIQDYRQSAEARSGMCEWCKKEATDLRDARDYDEGLAGRVYRVCGACVRRQNEEAEEDLRDSGYYDDCWDDDNDPYVEPDPGENEISQEARASFSSPVRMTCAKCRRRWDPKHRCRTAV